MTITDRNTQSWHWMALLTLAGLANAANVSAQQAAATKDQPAPVSAASGASPGQDTAAVEGGSSKEAPAAGGASTSEASGAYWLGETIVVRR